VSELAKSLLAFQKNAPSLHRDATNPHFKSKFLSLEGLMDAVLPVANNWGLVITQFPTGVETPHGTVPALRTRITHAESGEFLEDVMLLLPERDGPQAQGSALTYARRYSLMAALGLVADEDDDGNAATQSGLGEPQPLRADRPSGGSSSGASPKPELVTPPEDAKPSDYVVHFGKNRGVLLGSLTAAQLSWYATKWEVQDTPSDYDRRLKAAAVSLHAGDDSPLVAALSAHDDEIPF
jgi:hypothetical protein